MFFCPRVEEESSRIEVKDWKNRFRRYFAEVRNKKRKKDFFGLMGGGLRKWYDKYIFLLFFFFMNCNAKTSDKVILGRLAQSKI